MPSSPIVSYVHHHFSQSHFPGVALGIIRGEEVEFHGFGFANLEKKSAIDGDTLFAIGSMSKSFTALAVLILAEEGKLSLHDPVEKHLPIPLKACGKAVLVEHLLNHSSGLADPQDLLNDFSHVAPRLPMLPLVRDWEGVYAHLEEIGEWSFAEPGKEFHYWNMGFTLLSRIVELVSGQSFPEFVAERLFQPMGMRRTVYTGSDLLSPENVATAYLVSDGKLTPGPWASGHCVAGAGGVVSSVNDLSRYVRMFLGRGVLEDRRIVSEAIIAAMEEPTIPAAQSQAPFGAPHYARGLAKNPDFFGDVLISHGGSMGNSNSMMHWLPKQGCGVVAFCNSSTPLGNIPTFALAIAAGKNPYAHKLWQMERALEHVSGTYLGYRGLLQMTVQPMNGLLKISPLNGEEITLAEPVSVDAHKLLCRLPNSAYLEMPLEFRFKENLIDLVFERHLLKKYGKAFRLNPRAL